MPKNTTADVLIRWQKMDRRLAHPIGRGLNIPSFAEKYGVSAKTVHRDLAAFRDELGQKMIKKTLFIDPVSGWRKSAVAHTFWKYADGTPPLFHRTFLSIPKAIDPERRGKE